MVLNGANWIWTQEEGERNSYVEFFSSFKYSGGNVNIAIWTDSDYVLFLNGKFVCSNQYGGYDHYKIYDTIDLSKYAIVGENKLAILVWYFAATAVWETKGGADAFGKAGSLCQGWSAVPVYFYHKLGLVKKIQN